jgi:O-antigen/teichoic acid export membrane protein
MCLPSGPLGAKGCGMSSALLQVLCVAAPKALGGVLAVLLNGVLLTRLSPTEFGIYVLCLTFVTIADGVLGAAVDMAAIKLSSASRAQDPAHAAEVERWALLIKLGFVTGLIALLLPMARPLSTALFHREDPGLLILALTVTATVMALRSIGLHLQLAQRFPSYAGVELLAQSMRVAGIVSVLLWWQPSATTLTWAALCGGVLSLIGGVGIARLRRRRWVMRAAVGRQLMHAAGWMLVTFAFSSVLARADLFLLSHWSTIEQVGLYGAAQVFASIPEMFGLWLSVVFSPRVAPARAAGRLRELLVRLQAALLALALALGAVFALVLRWAPEWLPASFAGASAVLPPLLIGALAGLYVMPFVVPCVIFLRPRFIFYLDLISLPLLMFSYYWAITHSGALGAAWVSAGARTIKAALLQIAAWQLSSPLVAAPNATH